jgi:hypothetical protein
LDIERRSDAARSRLLWQIGSRQSDVPRATNDPVFQSPLGCTEAWA